MQGIRTIHHLACSGGTIICRCLAAMRDVVLLSEINPLVNDKVIFNPLCPLQQYNSAYGGLSQEELKSYFHFQIDIIEARCKQNGQKLIIRDHSHSDFFEKTESGITPLLKFLREKYEVLPVITLRNPVDSYLSTKRKGWLGDAKDFDSYCKKYLDFTSRYSDLNWYRYEDFTLNPDIFLENLCSELEIVYDPSYKENLSKHMLTGGSGRASDDIAPRPRRDFEEQLRDQAKASLSYFEICRRFGYGEEEFGSKQSSINIVKHLMRKHTSFGSTR